MSTFSAPDDVIPTTLFRSSNINNLIDATSAAFSLLPSETDLNNGTVNYGSCSSSAANTYEVTFDTAPSAYADGMLVFMKAPVSNSGAITINVNSLGAKTATRQLGDALITGDILAGKFFGFRYNLLSDCFEMQGASLGELTGNASINIASTLADDPSPTLGADLNVASYGIKDASGNELLGFETQASAANYITIKNAATLTPPSVRAAGSDENIDITFVPKGTGSVNFQDVLLVRPKIRDYSEVVATVSSASNVLTLDLETANHFIVTLTENVTTFAIQNWVVGALSGCTLYLTQAASAKTVDWSNVGVLWSGGSPPDLSTNSSKHVLAFTSPDGGTTVYGFISSQNAASS